jgi:hypothetical protein
MCVSRCVDDAVRRCARPVRLHAALTGHAREIGAAIVYEQWGWPLPPPAEDDVRQRWRGVPLIVDRVDSADFFANRRGLGQYEVVSLSKVVGIAAGGLARDSSGALLEFQAPRTPGPLPRLDFQQVERAGRLAAHPAGREWFKQSPQVHPRALQWLQDNCLVDALEAERRVRNEAALTLLDRPLAAGWPRWMVDAVAAGAGPVWAPVFRGASTELHWRSAGNLRRTIGIAAAVRMFNWSGNPLRPCYEPCVALPIHGGIEDLAAVLSVLEPVAA